ncbi:Zinc finger, GRF-type [Sesbania bispinosa]|nr:Zinc finger, GRF-type [Sesbania bispinosa]
MNGGGGKGLYNRGSGPQCDCGLKANVHTSKTRKNPNKAFYGCPMFKERKASCGFFSWLDDDKDTEIGHSGMEIDRFGMQDMKI